MIVHVSSLTTFHVLDLARQMARLDHLGQFYTALPTSMTPGVPAKKVCRQTVLLGPLFAARKIQSRWLLDALNWPTIELFDWWLANSVTRCDVFHCLSTLGLRAFRVARRRYNAVTVCDHGSTHIAYNDELLRSEFDRWGLEYRGQDPRVLEKGLAEYAECDLITVPSSFARRSFLEKGVSAEKVVKVSYGVDLQLFRPAPKEDQTFRVLYVGQMTLRKGLPYLLEALATAGIPNLELMLIGAMSAETEGFLAKYPGRVKYLGPKPRHELYRYYSQASVFVLSSVEEGLATVMAQAMACGIPVIATTNTGADDLFTDGKEGYIVPIRSPESIREKVTYLYENPEVRDRMSSAALECVQGLGGWNEYGEHAAHVYGTALAKQRR